MAGYDSYTKLLLHFDDEESPHFLDSALGHTVTAHGNAQIDTGIKKFGTGSGLFDGAGDYLIAANSNDWNFGTGDFTIDFWIYRDGAQDVSAGVCGGNTSSLTGWNLGFSAETTKLSIANVYGGYGIKLTNSSVIPNQTWTHMSLVRHGTDLRFRMNGVSDGNVTIASATTFNSAGTGFTVGRLRTNQDGYYFQGQLDEFRVSKGVARWTTDFTPPTEAYPSSVAYQLTPALQWASSGAVQLTPALQWITSEEFTKDLSLRWESIYSHRFCPNLINYEFDFIIPTIYSSKNITTVSGVLHSFTVNMKDTGSSGSTIIELYLAGTLKETQTISADNAEYETVVYFDMATLVYPYTTIEVRVTQVATGAADLKLCVYEMTFPFELDKTFFGNVKDSVSFVGINRDYLFNNSDSWTIDFNQPIYDVTHLTITDVNEDTTLVSYSISNGNFYRSRLTVTPYTTTSINKITAKIQDQNKKNYSFNFYPIIENNFADYPSYVSELTTEVDVFLPATNYKYSFDAGITWSVWGAISSDNTLSLDFTDASEGTNSLTVTYRNGTEEFTETINIYYASGVIDCGVVFYGETAKITYADAVPLDRIELYYADALADTFNIPVKDGMDTFTVAPGSKLFTVSTGSIYWNNERHYWDGSSYTVNPDFASNDFNTYWKYTFGFNTITKSFEFKEEIDLTPFSEANEDIYDNFIKIWTQKVVMFSLNSDWSSWSSNITVTALSVFADSIIPVNIDLDRVINVKILDVAGRTRDFTFDFIQTRYNIWRTVTITKSNVVESDYATTNIGGYAFQDNSSYWQSPTGGSLPHWVSYEFGRGDSRETIVEYAISGRGAYQWELAYPTDWKFQGSQEGTIWTDLDEVVGETFSAFDVKTYTISNTTAYVYYRLYVTGSSGGTYVEIMQLELHNSIGGANLAVYATDIEVLPGQIHGSSDLDIDIESEEWDLDLMNRGY